MSDTDILAIAIAVVGFALFSVLYTISKQLDVFMKLYLGFRDVPRRRRRFYFEHFRKTGKWYGEGIPGQRDRE